MLLGASGLVGGRLLELLGADSSPYERIVVLARRSFPVSGKVRLFETDFDRLEDSSELFGVDDVFCCLGTTIRKAGSPENFRRVDLEYPSEAAWLACSAGAKLFSIVSSMGADARSPLLYPRTKGEVEGRVSRAPFESVHILRPSLITGERAEPRFGEGMAKLLMAPVSRMMVGPLRKYRPIDAGDIAKAMLRLAIDRRTGVHIVESDKIADLAQDDG